MKVKVSPYRSVLVCDECDEEKDKLRHYGTEQLCEECLLGRYEEVDIDGE